ncbi:MAG: hypothetical protein J6Z14_02185 [Prevotella sp.]|nr:hypothetical protein [Prevotella sp.]
MKRRLFLLLALTLMSVGLNAQVLVFHLPDGAISTVTMPCSSPSRPAATNSSSTAPARTWNCSTTASWP